MRKILLTGLFCFLLSHLISLSCYANQKQDNDIKNSTVKIFTVSSEPDYKAPRKLRYNQKSSGSGCIIKGEKILTNAHVVSKKKLIEVQLYGDSKRYKAQLLYVSHEADLALLTVEDKTFFSGTESLSLGDFPETLQEVLVYGFPTGGDSLSITKGILSRVVYQKYAHSDYAFVAGQVDAAINPGSSGGPVIVDNKVVGVVMQQYSSSEIDNIGYMIPTPMIKHFINDIEDGQYHGFPELGFVTQKEENPGISQKYGQKLELTGVLVTDVLLNFAAHRVVKKGDVVLAIDGHKIANNATAKFRPKERISYTHYADMHQLGDKIRLRILRNGRIRNIEYKLLQKRKDVEIVSSKQ
jgi:S1-C subfamily serine protease